MNRLTTLLRSMRGAFDLPSIITAVVVVGILAAGVLVAIFGVIPWSQDNAAKQDLAAVRTAEGTHVSKDSGFVNLAGLQGARYLPGAVERLTVDANAEGTCYLGIAKSGTGKLFYSTDKANEPRVMTPTTTTTSGPDTAVPCLSGENIQDMVDEIGGHDPDAFKPVGDGEGTTADPGVGVKTTEDTDATIEPNGAVKTSALAVTDQSVKVSFENTSSTATTVRYGGRITCYDPARSAATTHDVDGYFDLNSNIFADMTLIVCSPGTHVIEAEIRPYDNSYSPSGTGFTGSVFRWRAPMQYSQSTWVSRGLTASYDGNWCIENQNNAATAGNPITLAHCSSIDAQRWQWNGDGEIRQSTLDHKCASASASLLVLAECTTVAGQSFAAKLFQGANSTGGLVQIVHKPSGKCVDVPGGVLTETQLGLAACNGANTQSWYMPGLAATLEPELQQPQPGAVAPAAPTNVTATAYPDTTANFTWDAVSGADDYRVEYNINGGAWTLKTEAQTDRSASITAAASDTINLRVTARNTAGESGYGTGSFTLPGTAVVNGGFENGMTAWTLGGNVNAQTTNSGHSGSYSAYLGGVASSDSSIVQSVKVPETGTSTLSFWYSPRSSEPGCACDWAEAQIRDASGAVLKSIFKGSGFTYDWTNKTEDLTPYRGQTVSIWFNVHNDSSNTTYALFDDVALVNNLAAVPATPVSVAATRSGDTAQVTWSLPSDGGSTVTSSTVTPYVEGVAQTPVTVSGGLKSASVSGLAGGTYYTFTVAANNAVGSSATSEHSSPVSNGGFETALASWTGGGTKAPSITASARSGSGALFLGNQATTDSSASQAIQVPESGTTGLSFWYHSTSAEPGCACDWAEAQVRDASGAVLKNIFKGNVNSTGWVNQTADLTPYRGQTVTVWFNVHNDSSNLTYAKFDDVTVTVAASTMATVPEDVTAIRTGGTAEVNWLQHSDGGAWITTYTVTPWVNGSAQTPILVTGTPAARTVTVPGLVDGTNYSFTVKATNAVGTTADSAASTTVKNGGFESNLASWTSGGTQAPVVSSAARTGLKSVYLGNKLSSDSNVAQTVEVPATGTTSVSFWYQPRSTEPGCACDYTELQIRDAATGAILKTAFKSNGNTTSWLNVNADLTEFKGKKITLWFNMHNDSSNLSSSFIDDIRVATTG